MLTLLLLTNRADEISFLKCRLNRQGYQVVSCERQDESLEDCLTSVGQVDAVFLPSRNISFLRELRSQPKTQDSTVICFVSPNGQLVPEDPNVRGCDLVIKRPNTQEELLQSLVDALQRRGVYT